MKICCQFYCSVTGFEEQNGHQCQRQWDILESKRSQTSNTPHQVEPYSLTETSQSSWMAETCSKYRSAMSMPYFYRTLSCFTLRWLEMLMNRRKSYNFFYFLHEQKAPDRRRSLFSNVSEVPKSNVHSIEVIDELIPEAGPGCHEAYSGQ